MSSPTTIEDLPPEMLCEFFRHLSLNDLAVCSMVNRRWHSLHSGLKLFSLVIYDRFDNFINHWCHSNEAIKEKELCSMKMFDRLADSPLLSKIKHLSLCDIWLEFDLNELNRFSELAHLELDIRHLYDRSARRVDLSLSKLKVLALHQCYNYFKLYIDSPQLSVLLIHTEDVGLWIRHPEGIEWLDVKILNPCLIQPYRTVLSSPAFN